MPQHYNWRRSRPSSSSESPPIRPSRSSGSSYEASSSDQGKRSPSPPSSVDYSHLHLPPLNIVQPPKRSQVPFSRSTPNLVASLNLSKDACRACGATFDAAIEARQPRMMPCLHSFCTRCLVKVYDYLEVLTASKSATRSQRYSWRRYNQQQQPQNAVSASKTTFLGNFLCPLCHTLTPIFGGRRESVISAFPLDKLIITTKSSSAVSEHSSRYCFSYLDTKCDKIDSTIYFSHQPLLEMVVREIHPKIKVIQNAVFETELARQSITENVASIEARLLPRIPSGTESIRNIRSETLSRLHQIRLRRLNMIVRRQLMLKQCEKVVNRIMLLGNAINCQSVIDFDSGFKVFVQHTSKIEWFRRLG
jgi:hypothetical protein